MMHLQKVEYPQLAEYRRLYLKSLPCIQEIYLELLNHEADSYQIELNNEILGYSIVSVEKTMLEFFVFDQFVSQAYMVFCQLVGQLGIQSVYCKSFDPLLLDCCLVQCLTYKTVGKMYRDKVFDVAYPLDGLTVQLATLSDLPFYMNQDDECFEPKSELKTMIESQSVFNFYEGETLVGSGFFNRIHEDFNGYDLGVWVDEPHRRKGVATRIISYLNQRCLQIGGKPCLACAFDNYLSQKTIEKNGFISKYRLLEFEVH